jgi:hypothetical protein
MAEVSVINVTSLTPIVAAAIVSGQQVTIYDQGGIGYRAEVQELVGAAQRLNGCQCVLTKTITIPTAEVLTLFTTQVNFGLTVPAGYYAKPLGVDLWATFNSVPYATNTTLLIFAVGGNVDILNGDVLAFAGNSSTQLTFTTAATDTQYVDGADLYVKAMTGDPTAGDSDITLVLTYILLPTP